MLIGWKLKRSWGWNSEKEFKDDALKTMLNSKSIEKNPKRILLGNLKRA